MRCVLLRIQHHWVHAAPNFRAVLFVHNMVNSTEDVKNVFQLQQMLSSKHKLVKTLEMVTPFFVQPHQWFEGRGGGRQVLGLYSQLRYHKVKEVSTSSAITRSLALETMSMSKTLSWLKSEDCMQACTPANGWTWWRKFRLVLCFNSGLNSCRRHRSCIFAPA